jgi:hypothetical protein
MVLRDDGHRHGGLAQAGFGDRTQRSVRWGESSVRRQDEQLAACRQLEQHLSGLALHARPRQLDGTTYANGIPRGGP